MDRGQELQAAIVDVAIAARAACIARMGPVGARAMADEFEMFCEQVEAERTAREHGLTMTRAIELLRGAARDIRHA